MSRVDEALRSACAKAGIVYRDVPPDGQWHQTDVDGDRHGKGDARIKLFADGEGGIVANWKGGAPLPFFVADTSNLSPADIAAQRYRVDAAKRTAEAERAQSYAEASEWAASIWDAAAPADDQHPYLISKGVKAHGLRLDKEELVVPMRDAAGVLRSLQFIREDGTKRFLKGGKKSGCYYAIGQPTGRICIAEGYATGASVYEATGQSVAVAFDAGNLRAAAAAIKEKLPDQTLVFCADDDYRTDGNPGLTKAAEAAISVDGLLALSDFGADRPGGATDFNDLATHLEREAVERAVANAKRPDVPTPQPETPKSTASDPGLRVLTVAEFLAETIQPREEILAPWLLSQSLNMIFAWRGVGKTFVALNIAYAVATGGAFLNWKAAKARKVLYLDGEMAAAALQERLKGIVLADERDFDPEYLRIVTPDLQPGAMPDLATREGQEAIETVINDAELIIVDNISTLVRNAGRENDAESWNEVGVWALRQRQRGRSVLFLHHSGKGGAQRGSSKKEDTLDAVICLKHPSDYSPDENARFEVHFEKSRNGGGVELKPFEAKLGEDQTGKPLWTFQSVDDSTFNRVVKLGVEGLSQRDIAEELGINKSNVSRHMRRARDQGMLPREGK